MFHARACRIAALVLISLAPLSFALGQTPEAVEVNPDAGRTPTGIQGQGQTGYTAGNPTDKPEVESVPASDLFQPPSDKVGYRIIQLAGKPDFILESDVSKKKEESFDFTNDSESRNAAKQKAKDAAKKLNSDKIGRAHV